MTQFAKVGEDQWVQPEHVASVTPNNSHGMPSTRITLVKGGGHFFSSWTVEEIMDSLAEETE